ncbi:unnamed protein product [Adineta steineri]|uniref:Uncharacterized protein n=1 Tax=Adineta steineri TaxID=433720 RepID=A0A819JUP4_9BILA|nr:unnamed protein product [Adineta steineri]CAF3938798.1 unnamed protein product [Adineta steineri]
MSGSDVSNKVKFGIKLETKLIKNDVAVCKENNSDDGVDDNSQISKELMKYSGIDNDSETKAVLEQHPELISMESHDKLIGLAINKEMNDVICSLI